MYSAEMSTPTYSHLPGSVERHAVRARRLEVGEFVSHVTAAHSPVELPTSGTHRRRLLGVWPGSGWLVEVAQNRRFRCCADSPRGRFCCFATAHQAIAARVPAVGRSGCGARTGHQSGHRSAGRRPSARWSPGYGACRAENRVAVLQVIPRSLLVQPARRLPGPFIARCHSFS